MTSHFTTTAKAIEDDGLICGVPVICTPRAYHRLEGLPIDDFARSMNQPNDCRTEGGTCRGHGVT
jgi:hypothetical protein